jgi:hypothetical protein
MGKRAGWSDTTPAEEALARLRELERAFEMKAHKFVYTAIRSLEALERATKKSYPKLFKIEEGDFFKAYQLIKANWGSVKAFVDSFDAVVPPGATRVS